MTTQEIADKLVAYCRAGEFQKCYDELYSPNVVSLEPAGSPMERVEGIDGILAKGKAWNEMMEEFHGSTITDPVVCGNHFSLGMTMDATFKEVGREKMEEICVYEVQDGKVVKEQFFYPNNK